MVQLIHAIQVGCDSCSGPHLTKDYDLDENMNKKAQVCLSSVDRFDDYWRRQKRSGIPNTSTRRRKKRYIDNKVTTFTKKSKHNTKRYPISKGVLACFREASEKRHNAADIVIIDQQATLENQQSSILNIKTQVGQLSMHLQERLLGTLPSNIETNLKVHVLAMTTEEGEKSDPLVI